MAFSSAPPPSKRLFRPLWDLLGVPEAGVLEVLTEDPESGVRVLTRLPWAGCVTIRVHAPPDCPADSLKRTQQRHFSAVQADVSRRLTWVQRAGFWPARLSRLLTVLWTVAEAWFGVQGGGFSEVGQTLLETGWLNLQHWILPAIRTAFVGYALRWFFQQLAKSLVERLIGEVFSGERRPQSTP